MQSHNYSFQQEFKIHYSHLFSCRNWCLDVTWIQIDYFHLLIRRSHNPSFLWIKHLYFIQWQSHMYRCIVLVYCRFMEFLLKFKDFAIRHLGHCTRMNNFTFLRLNLYDPWLMSMLTIIMSHLRFYIITYVVRFNF